MAQTYRVGLIGHTGRGNYGHGHDEAWKDVPRAKVVAVADPDEEGRAKALRTTGAATGYADYRRMLDREQLDLVAIALRFIDRHAEMALAALERGCHVWMEKPFCRNLEEADAIVAAAEMRHLKAGVSHQTRWSPTLDVVRREIAGGLIGRVLELRGRGKEDATRGGGEDLWVLGSHVLDLMRVFAGDPQTCMATVLEGGRPISKRNVIDGHEGIGPLAGDAVNAMFTFDNGITGYFGSHRGTGRGETRFALQVFGSEGIVEVPTGYLATCYVLQDPLWSPGRTGKTWVPISSNGLGTPEAKSKSSLHGGNVAAINDLLDCIADPMMMRQPRCSLYDGRWTIEMISSVFESQRRGSPVSLPLKTRVNPLTLLTS